MSKTVIISGRSGVFRVQPHTFTPNFTLASLKMLCIPIHLTYAYIDYCMRLLNTLQAGFPLLTWACSYNKTELAAILISAGADLEAKCKVRSGLADEIHISTFTKVITTARV